MRVLKILFLPFDKRTSSRRLHGCITISSKKKRKKKREREREIERARKKREKKMRK